MYLQAPPKAWYDSSDRLNHKERKRTDDQKLEHAYKDNENKRGEDPLAMMQAYLKRRDLVREAQERQKSNPWADTPRSLTDERTPVQPSLLSKRDGKNRYKQRSPSPLHHIEAGPARPSAPSDPLTAQEAAAKRVLSERDRAKALILARRRENGSAFPTPRSEFGYQTGMYNRAETRDAKGYQDVRWDSESSDKWRHDGIRGRHRL